MTPRPEFNVIKPQPHPRLETLDKEPPGKEPLGKEPLGKMPDREAAGKEAADRVALDGGLTVFRAALKGEERPRGKQRI
ncbi:hypothetical protein LA080_009695 [Diaporthe eres]|nr:hypothetical protein LA080_009695 [Diaporthe eres]